MFLNYLHRNRYLGKLFPTLKHCINAELGDCSSVLDIGCGPEPVFVRTTSHRCVLGVEPFERYRQAAVKSGVYDEVIGNRIEECEFSVQQFDAVLLIDVIEHMTEDEASLLLRKAKSWAKKKVIVSTPNGFRPQIAVDDNELQRHLSGWTEKDLKDFGFRVRGMAGPKFLRRDYEHHTMKPDLSASMKWKPRTIWFLVASVLQAVTFKFPDRAFSLFAVWDRSSALSG